MRPWLKKLFSSDNSEVNTQFVLAIFCSLSGFVAAAGLYVTYGAAYFWTGKDIPPNIMELSKIFIFQTVSGAAAAVFHGFVNRDWPREEGGLQPQPPIGPPGQ